MHRSGTWDIECHSRNGHGLVKVDAKGSERPFFANRRWVPAKRGLETMAEFRQRVQADLDGSIENLRRNGFPPPRFFAHPRSAGVNDANDPATVSVVNQLLKKRFVASVTNAELPRPLDVWAVALMIAAAGALAWRRAAPMVALGGAVGVVGIYLLGGYLYGPIQLCMVVAMFEVARRSRLRVSLLACGLAAAVAVAMQAGVALLVLEERPDQARRSPGGDPGDQHPARACMPRSGRPQAQARSHAGQGGDGLRWGCHAQILLKAQACHAPGRVRISSLRGNYSL